MNERQFGARLREVLNGGVAHLDPGTARRLQAARLRALERQRTELSPVAAFADNVLGRLVERTGTWALVLPLALLLAGVPAYHAWEQHQRVEEIEEIDARLLTDELPIDAYLDRGFQRWLNQREQE